MTNEEKLQELLDEATYLAAKVYGNGTGACLKSLCRFCVRPIYTNGYAGWKHMSFSDHNAEPWGL